MRKLLFVLLIISYIYPQIQNKKSEIIGKGNYYFGSGTAINAREAKDKALAELTSQIAVNVSSAFSEKIIEKNGKVEESVKSILNTHSAATLRNVKTVKEATSDGKVMVFCYLKKDEVDKIFEERKKLIADICRKAEYYASEYNMASALKLYYFASILLNSLPDEIVEYEGINYTTKIPEAINQILSNIKFKYLRDHFVNNKERDITLAVKYKDHYISRLDFMFWDGSNQIEVNARDGQATFKLIGSCVNFKKLDLNIKYSYYEARKEYHVVNTLWDVVIKPAFDSKKTIKIYPNSGEEEQNKEKKVIQNDAKPDEKKAENIIRNDFLKDSPFDYNIKYTGQADSLPDTSIIKETDNFLTLLQNFNITKLKKHYQDDEFLINKVKNYVAYNSPVPNEKNIGSNINKTAMGWELRRIRMLHQYPSINKQATEYLVLDFDRQGNLIDINTSITKHLYEKFVKAAEYGKDWKNRQQIIKFLEKYRSAYLTRDIETVNKMFSEDALIIVGRKIRKKDLPKDMVKYKRLNNEPEYEYLKLKKDEFISRQRRIFKHQSDIFLDFASFDIIRKNDQPMVYGIEMRQNYYSTTYSDEGYLFLLIDFEPDEPLIYVRAWQPNTWSEDKLIKTANYKIHK